MRAVSRSPARGPESPAPAGPVAPWGSPGTPLLPRWYFQTRSSTALPSQLRRFADTPTAPLRSVGDLARIWEYRSDPLTKTELQLLRSFAWQVAIPPDDHVVVWVGADVARLLELPLTARTRNCLRRSLHAGWLSSDEGVTVAQLWAQTNFGFTSLLNLMCVLEAAVESGFFSAPADPPRWTLPPPGPVPSAPRDPEREVARASASTALSVLLTAAREVNGCQTLAEALEDDLGELVSVLGLADCFREIDIADLVDGQSLVRSLFGALADLWESLNHTKKAVMAQRVLSADPRSLEELGRLEHLSRERIRQITRELYTRIHQATDSEPAPGGWSGALAMRLCRQLGPVTTSEQLDELISVTLKPADLSTIRGEANPEEEELREHVLQMAGCLLYQQTGYVRSGEVCLDQSAVAVVDALRAAASSLADDVGLIDESELKDHLSDEGWLQHWDVLVDQCGLHRLNGRLVLRETAKARAKAALLSIGRPATKEEVGALSGLGPAKAGAQLSGIASVVRADKKRWGLAEWVDDVYEGIPAEIIQRITEDGGAVRLERLLEELPRMFGVAEGSVLAYSNSPRFQIRDGYVSLADPSSIRMRHLDDVIHGRTAEGFAYWSFKAERRYFEGYSVAGLPGEVARALGCEPDGRLRVPVAFPHGCDPVSVNWPLTSLTGANVGYLSMSLKKLGAAEGDRVLLVLEGRNVSFRLADGQSHQLDQPHRPDRSYQHAQAAGGAGIAGGGAASSDRAKQLLERMKDRRRGL